jgi:diguanylate cyclase (GGDEF)-like protein/PAS domain S-box-containing protein
MLQINFFVILLVLSTLVSGGVALLAFQRRPAVGSLEMAGLMLVLSFWTLTNAGEAMVTSLNAKITWSVISYLANQNAAVMFLLFTLTYTRQDHHLSSYKKLALFLMPAISIGMAVTNSYHRLLWPSVYLRAAPYLGVIGQYTHGPWFWVETIYAYVLLGLAVFALLQGIFRFPYLFSLHHRLLLLTALAPWLLSIIYTFLPNAVLGLDIAPLAFCWSGVWLYWGITRRNFLDFIPVARKDILESLHEGVLLFDMRGRLIEANQAARSFFRIRDAAHGQPASDLFAEQPEILYLLSQATPAHVDLELPQAEPLPALRSELPLATPPSQVIQLNLVPLENELGKALGVLATAADVSEQRRFEKALKASEERYRLLVENQGDGVCIVNSKRIFIFANPGAERIYGVAPGALVGRHLLDFIPPDQIPVHEAQVALRDRGIQTNYEMEIVRQNGERRVIEVTSARHDVDPHGLRASYSVFRDITARKQAERALRARERFLAMLNDITRSALGAADVETMLQLIADQIGALYQSDGCYITLWDDQRQMTVPAAAFGREHDTYTSEPYGMPDEITMTESVLNAGHALAADDALNSPYVSRSVVEQYGIRSLLGLPLIAGGRKLGAVLVGFDSLHTFTDDDLAMGEQVAGQLALAVLKASLLAETITINHKLSTAMQTLDLLATTDKLTGALNRHKFDELINYQYKQLDRYRHPVSLILFDIDRFKEINDSYGHHTGDQVLVEIAKIVKSNIRECDSLVRWGGDEFLILAPNIHQPQAVLLAEKIRAIVTGCVLSPMDRLTISIGVSELCPGESPEEPVRRADQALYQAKQNGRNQVCALNQTAKG